MRRRIYPGASLPINPIRNCKTYLSLPLFSIYNNKLYVEGTLCACVIVYDNSLIYTLLLRYVYHIYLHLYHISALGFAVPSALWRIILFYLFFFFTPSYSFPFITIYHSCQRQSTINVRFWYISYRLYMYTSIMYIIIPTVVIGYLLLLFYYGSILQAVLG